MFKNYGVTADEVKEHIVFISDRGPNIKYGLKNAGYIRLTCYAHIIHNLVCAMFKEPDVKAMIAQCSELTSYVKNQGMNRNFNPSLKLYTTTRWNSVCIMLDAIIKNYHGLYDLLSENQRLRNEERLKRRMQADNKLVELISVLDVCEMVKVRDFLLPFKVI